METAEKVIKLTGVVPAFVTLGIIALILIVLLLTGYLKINFKGFSLQRPSVGNEPTKKTPELMVSRETLVKQTKLVEDFILFTRQKMMDELRDNNLSSNYLHVTLVCEKMYERCLTWILLNHIEETDEYINWKTDEAFKCIIASVGALNPELSRDKSFRQLIKQLSGEFTKDFVHQIVQLRQRDTQQ